MTAQQATAPQVADPRTAAPRVTARRAAALTALALLLAGCSAPTKMQVPVTATSAAADEEAAPDLEPFYGQPLEWAPCDDFQCATATVPIDYDDPGAGSLELALRRAPATGGESLGSLLINPGGPGASGVDFLESAVTAFSPVLLERYDVVGFDPRGVGRSSPVRCVDDDAKDDFLSRDFDYSTDAGIQQSVDAFQEFGKACAENTGTLLGHVDTRSAARDLDVLRAALSDEKLTYLGYSYGTLLGATYADLFPETVGRMVLDGAVDPSLERVELGRGQAIGFEGALRAYVEDCRAGSECPLTGTVEQGLQQVAGVVDQATRSPLRTDQGRPLTGSLAFTGVAAALYDEESWPVLTEALTRAVRQDDGTVLLALADFYNDRNEDGTYASNIREAFIAVSCLDSVEPADIATMRATAAELAEAAPTVGRFFGYGGTVCAEWPHEPTGEVGPIAAEGAPPVVVIGTTNDPATPYAWAEGLAEQLSSGVLLTYVGEGHTAYGRSNDCVAGAVDAYLVEGTVPADGTRC